MTNKKSKETTSIRASSVDVARLANVSQATVSRVLNHPDKVGESTKRRVYQAIKELRYVPNENARNLVSGRSKVITLISGSLENPFFVDSTAFIVDYATARGYKVNIHIIDDADILETYRLVLANRPDGLIMSCILYDDLIIDHLQGLDLPFVSYNRRHKEKLNYVELDNFEAGRKGCLYLHEKGYESIFWVGGRQDVSTFRYRFEGFKATSNQCYRDDNMIMSVNDEQLDDAILTAQIMQWYQTTQGKKALFAATDSIAIKLLDLTKKMGLVCPSDIGILGIDNVELSQHAYINLTSVGSEDNLGKLAIKALINQIESSVEENINITVPAMVFERGTIK